MPELPEVETIRRDLDVLIGQKISALDILDAKTASPSAAFLKRALMGKKLLKIERRGKLLIFVFSADQFLLIHLKMTGQLIFQSKKRRIAGGHSLAEGSFEKAVGGKLPNKYTRAIFSFSDGGQLFFNDLRKFGYLKLVNAQELKNILAKNYGPEPLTPEFSLARFQEIIKNRKTKIKAVLLNQKLIAGLGNIYVDEALFAAGIRPTRLASSLKKEELEKLYKAINRLIKKALEYRGTTFSNYVDSRGKKGNFSRFLKVYGRQKEACLVCKTKIVKVKLAGRGTTYCPHCQK